MEFCCANQLFVVSDGGVSEGLGYYGWVIANPSTIIWEGGGQGPVSAIEMDSLCAESRGLLHAIRVFTAQIQLGSVNSTTFILASDNLELVKRVRHLKQ